MNLAAVKTDAPAHVEHLGHGKDELELHGSPAGLHRTTLCQVIFSIFIGLSGWMYNFDLGEELFYLYTVTGSQKV
jgi:hypothetical protein